MADPIPFGVESGPYVVVRVRPRSDGLSVYSVSSCDASDEGDEDMIPSSNVASHIAQTSMSTYTSFIFVRFLTPFSAQYINVAYSASKLARTRDLLHQLRVLGAEGQSSTWTTFLAICSTHHGQPPAVVE